MGLDPGCTWGSLWGPPEEDLRRLSPAGQSAVPVGTAWAGSGMERGEGGGCCCGGAGGTEPVAGGQGGVRGEEREEIRIQGSLGTRWQERGQSGA